MVTRKDIAQMAGVSVSVVSRALNNSGYVNKDKKKEIIRLAKEMGYQANPIAISLANKRTKQIVFYCKELENAFNIMVYEGMLETAKKYGYMVMIQADLDFEKIKTMMVDGLILPNEFLAQMYLDQVGRNYSIPTVCATYGNPVSFSKCIPVVESNAWEATNLAVNYLKNNGHEKIALLMPYDYNVREVRAYAWKSLVQYTFGDDIEKYYLGISKEGLGNDPRVMHFLHEQSSNYRIDDSFFEKGELGAHIFCERKLDATALITFNDEMALGFIKSIKKLGYSVPNDISVVGIDGIFSRRYTDQILTSVSLNPKEQGAKCAEKMIKILNGEKYKYVSHVPLKIIEGETVKKIN